MKKTKIITIALCFIFIVLCFIGIVVHFHNKNNFKNNNKERYIATIVMKGLELKIPDKYMSTIDPEIGLMYWNYEHFDMIIDVVELNFDEEISAKIDEYNEVMNEELFVLRPYSEFTIDGKSYIYMLYYDSGVPTLHGYTKATDDKTFEIMVLCNEMAIVKPQTDEEIRVKCEALIGEAHSIIRTAEATDKDDSPSGEVLIGAKAYENLYEEVEINMSDKFIDHDFVQGITTKVNVNYKIKQNYYCTGTKSKDNVCYLKFYSDYNGTLVTVYIQEKDEATYNIWENIEEGCAKWGYENSYVEEYVSGVHTFYCYWFCNEYVEENQVVKEYDFVAASDLGDGYIYFVEANGKSEDIKNPDFYKEFFDVNLSKTK